MTGRCTALLAGLWSTLAAAQAPAPPPAPAPAEPQRIEVDGQLDPNGERRQSLQLMTIVGRDELDEYGDTSVLDVLQRLPGISIEGEQPRLRGMGGGYTQILINGEPAPPGFSLEQLSPADIERIEIIKGPSAEFGGVAGTINVILRTPPRLRQRELRATLAYRSARPVGSFNASWGDRIGALGFHLPISGYQWAGANRSFIERLSRTSDGQPREHRVQGQDQWHGGGINLAPRAEWKLSEQQTLSAHVFMQRNETGNASQRQLTLLQGQPLSITSDRTEASGTWELARLQLQWVQKTPQGQRFEVKGSWQDSRGHSRLHYEGLAGTSAPLLRETDATNDESRVALGARLRWPVTDGHVLVAGTDLEQRERHELRRVYENGIELVTTSQGVPFDVQLRRTVLFFQDEWSVSPRLAAMVGLRGELLHTEASGVDGRFGTRSTVATPLAQFRYALDAKGRDLLRGSASRASRLPDLGSLMGRYVLNTTYDRFTPNTPLAADSAGNPQLRPERALAVELAWENHLAGGGVVSLSAFHRRIEGLIRRRIALETVQEANVPRWVSRPVNFGDARSGGVELEIKGRGDELLPRLFAPRSPLGLRGSLSLYRSRVEQVDDPDARLEGQPPWQATLGFDHQPRSAPGPRSSGAGFSFGANVAYTPGYATQQTDLQRIRRSASRRFDAYLLWRVDRQTQLRFSVQNARPVDSRTWSEVRDLDGFTARSFTQRPNQTQFNLNLVARF